MPIGDSSHPWVAALAASASGAADEQPGRGRQPEPLADGDQMIHGRRMIIAGRRRYGAGTTTRIASGRYANSTRSTWPTYSPSIWNAVGSSHSTVNACRSCR